MNSPYNLQQVDTNDVEAVRRAVTSIALETYGSDAEESVIRTLIEDIVGIFNGRLVYFQPMDAGYHNLEHTLQATLCWARLVGGYQQHAEAPVLSIHFFYVGLAAVLLHDVGYLKEADDDFGSGAKFTYVHERRSCELAQIYLDQCGWAAVDIEAVQQIINCTGPRATIGAIAFNRPADKILGQMVCTADYLGQMSDPAYLAKLPVLFKEFEESDQFRGIPLDRRCFRSVEDMLRRTPSFWYHDVLPRLDYDCEGVYRYLAAPYPYGVNPYLSAIHRNIDRVKAELKLASG